MRYILVSGMLFKDSYELRVTSYEQKKKENNSLLVTCYSLLVICCLSLVTCYSLLVTSFSHAELFDRVVAFVDDQAITLSEFQQQYENTLKISPHISEEEVLNTMINRKLLLREARRYRIEAASEEEIIKVYIDLKVRAFVWVDETEMVEFYRQNITRFSGKDFEDVREEIEKYLIEREINERLRKVIKKLRGNAYIKVQL